MLNNLEEPNSRKILFNIVSFLSGIKIDVFLSFRNKNVITEAQNDEIGPNFSETQLIRMLNRDSKAAFQRKCKKISGNDNAYTEAVEANKQVKTCVTNWIQTEGIYINYQLAKLTHDVKPLIKK